MKIVLIVLGVLLFLFFVLSLYAILKNNNEFDRELEKIMKEQNKKNK